MKKLFVAYALAGFCLGFLLMVTPIFLVSYQLLSMGGSHREAYPEVAPSTEMSKIQDFKTLTQWSESRFGIGSAKPNDYIILLLMMIFSLSSAVIFSYALRRRFAG